MNNRVCSEKRSIHTYKWMFNEQNQMKTREKTTHFRENSEYTSQQMFLSSPDAQAASIFTRNALRLYHKNNVKKRGLFRREY